MCANNEGFGQTRDALARLSLHCSHMGCDARKPVFGGFRQSASCHTKGCDSLS